MGTTHELVCAYYPSQNSTFVINGEYASIYFRPHPINGTLYGKVGQFQWFIDSISSDYIRYIAYSPHNDIAHHEMLVLNKN